MEKYKEIYKAYRYFINNLPIYLQKFNGDTGGCGAWAIGLNNYFKNLGYNCIIKELDKGIHYWVEVENCSMDWQNFIKQNKCPNFDYINNKNKIVCIPYYKTIRIISKRVAYGNLYIWDFLKIGEEIAKKYLLLN